MEATLSILIITGKIGGQGQRPLVACVASAGYRVEVATDEVEGLSASFRPQVGLVILDLVALGAPGLDLCRQIRQRTTVPVLVLGPDWANDAVVALRSGADDYVGWPYHRDVFLAHVRAVLRRAAIMRRSSDRVSSRLVS